MKSHSTKSPGNRFYVLLLAAAALALIPASLAVAEEANTHEGMVVSAGAGRLAITGLDGKEHSYEIGDMVKITVNGHMGKLDDLKTGIRIRVTTDKAGHALNVATVDAIKSQISVAGLARGSIGR